MKRASVSFHDSTNEAATRRPNLPMLGNNAKKKPAPLHPKQSASQLSAQEWHKTHKIKWVAPSAVRLLRQQALGPMGCEGAEWPDWDPAEGNSRRTGRITHAIDQANIVTTNHGKNAFSVMQFYELGCELWRPVPPPLPSVPTTMKAAGGLNSPKSVLRRPNRGDGEVDLPPLRAGGRKVKATNVTLHDGGGTKKGTIRLSWDSTQSAGWSRMKTPASGRASPAGRGGDRGDAAVAPDGDSYLPKIASRFGKALEGEVQWQRHRRMMSRRYALSRRGKRALVSDLDEGGFSYRTASMIQEDEGGLTGTSKLPGGRGSQEMQSPRQESEMLMRAALVPCDGSS